MFPTNDCMYVYLYSVCMHGNLISFCLSLSLRTHTRVCIHPASWIICFNIFYLLIVLFFLVRKVNS